MVLTSSLKPGFHPNATHATQAIAFGWKPGFTSSLSLSNQRGGSNISNLYFLFLTSERLRATQPWLVFEPAPDMGRQIVQTYSTEFSCAPRKTWAAACEAKTWTKASSQGSAAPYRSCHTGKPAKIIKDWGINAYIPPLKSRPKAG